MAQVKRKLNSPYVLDMNAVQVRMIAVYFQPNSIELKVGRIEPEVRRSSMIASPPEKATFLYTIVAHFEFQSLRTPT